ncbi:MAG: BadF/BadG/BcrA/BcrD ATPase family protein [Sphaerochaetaceae bacterium]
MNHYIAMDGGGTTCRLILCDENKTLFKKEAGSSNPYGVGWDAAWKHVGDLITSAMETVEVKEMDITALAIGSAGMGREKDKQRLTSLLSVLLPHTRIAVYGDQEIFLVGGLGGMSGIAVIAGTGSIACGRNEQGMVVRAGGFGWRLGDEGSAFWLAKEAIRRTLAAKEGRDLPSSLEATICSFFRLETLQDAIYFVNDPSVDKTTIAAFAPFVTKAAQNGDELAYAIEEEGAMELVDLVTSITERLPVPFSRAVVCGGGSFSHDQILKGLFLKEMRKRLPSYSVIFTPLHSALEGALMLARRNII